MTIYRGPGGTGEARTDSDVTEVRIIADEAEGYKDQAATSASAAASSASAAATAETNAETAEANAETAEANAEAAQAAAEAAQAAAEAAQTAAEAAQTAAELAETNAETAEANAETAEANAETAQAAAEAALASAQAVYDNFDDRYLGAKTSNPTVDNDGNALLTGALYFNTAAPEMRVYNGSVWQNFSAASAVSSFNTRTGAVTLSSSDVTTALGYTPVQTETDPVYVASSWYSTTNNASNWNTAYGWGNHASAGYATDSAVVKLTGSQTIAGTKTFSNNAVISVTDNTNAALNITQLGTANALLVSGNVTVSTGALEVGSSSASTAIFDLQTSATGRAYIRFQDTDTNVGTIEYDHTTNLMSFRTNDVDSVFIDSSGNVGIGTDTPATKFNISGTGGIVAQINGTTSANYRAIASPTGISYFACGDTDDAYVGGLAYNHTDDSLDIVANNAVRATINSSGTFSLASTSGLSISRTAVTSPASTDGNVFSGTYTPSLTNTTNLTASTPSACQYIRVGNTVTVSGQVSGITMTAAASTSTVLKMTLPIASALASTRQVGGTAVFYSAASRGTAVAIYGDVTNDIAELNWAAPTTTASQAFAFSFTYQVL